MTIPVKGFDLVMGHAIIRVNSRKAVLEGLRMQSKTYQNGKKKKESIQSAHVDTCDAI
jgi:hypothetical protein